jgi:hypothetical protein
MSEQEIHDATLKAIKEAKANGFALPKTANLHKLASGIAEDFMENGGGQELNDYVRAVLLDMTNPVYVSPPPATETRGKSNGSAGSLSKMNLYYQGASYCVEDVIQEHVNKWNDYATYNKFAQGTTIGQAVEQIFTKKSNGYNGQCR